MPPREIPLRGPAAGRDPEGRLRDKYRSKSKPKTRGVINLRERFDQRSQRRKSQQADSKAAKAASYYVDELGLTLRSIAKDIKSKEEGAQAYLVWSAVAATLRNGVGAVVNGRVAPPDQWERRSVANKAARAARYLRQAGMLKEAKVLSRFAKQWSDDVKTKWSPPEGFFSGSASSIASGLKSNSKDLQQAMSRLNFYINRAGKNLSSDDKTTLALAKVKLRNLYKKSQ